VGHRRRHGVAPPAGGQACCPALSRARRALRRRQRQPREGASPPPGHRRPRGTSGSAGAPLAGAPRGHGMRAELGGAGAPPSGPAGGGAAHWALRMSISVLQLWCSQCLPTCFSASARASSSCARVQPMCDTAPDTNNDGPCRSVSSRARRPGRRGSGTWAGPALRWQAGSGPAGWRRTAHMSITPGGPSSALRRHSRRRTPSVRTQLRSTTPYPLCPGCLATAALLASSSSTLAQRCGILAATRIQCQGSYAHTLPGSPVTPRSSLAAARPGAHLAPVLPQRRLLLRQLELRVARARARLLQVARHRVAVALPRARQVAVAVGHVLRSRARPPSASTSLRRCSWTASTRQPRWRGGTEGQNSSAVQGTAAPGEHLPVGQLAAPRGGARACRCVISLRCAARCASSLRASRCQCVARVPSRPPVAHSAASSAAATSGEYICATFSSRRRFLRAGKRGAVSAAAAPAPAGRAAAAACAAPCVRCWSSNRGRAVPQGSSVLGLRRVQRTHRRGCAGAAPHASLSEDKVWPHTASQGMREACNSRAAQSSHRTQARSHSSCASSADCSEPVLRLSPDQNKAHNHFVRHAVPDAQSTVAALNNPGRLHNPLFFANSTVYQAASATRQPAARQQYCAMHACTGRDRGQTKLNTVVINKGQSRDSSRMTIKGHSMLRQRHT